MRLALDSSWRPVYVEMLLNIWSLQEGQGERQYCVCDRENALDVCASGERFARRSGLVVL